MIVARVLDKSKGKIFSGSSKIDRYSGEKGWFPIEGFNFGFDDKGDTSAGGAAGKGAPGKAPTAASAHPAGGAAPGKGGKQFSQLSMEKQVDVVSCLLMELAMSEAGTKKGTDSKQQTKLEVDIHILSSVQIEQKVERFMFTNLMIHLEAVNILGWQIHGSGDNRPTETVTLRYDRAAMIYVRTPDATRVDSYIGPKGWDQTNSKPFSDEEFNWDKSKWQEFLMYA